MLPLVDLSAYVQPAPAAYFEAVNVPLQAESRFAAGDKLDILLWAEETASGLRKLRDDVLRAGASNIGDLIQRAERLYAELSESQQALKAVAASLRSRVQKAQRAGVGADALREFLGSMEEHQRWILAGDRVLEAYEEILPDLVVHRFVTPDATPSAARDHQEIVEDFGRLAEDSLAAAWEGESS